jgi:acetylornithine deacetylase
VRTEEILERLVAFETVSDRPNGALVDYVRDLLGAAGIACEIMPDQSGAKSSVFATIGPDGPGGVLLSGHSDVVPVAGQAWTRPPFRLTAEGGRLYGRGTTDMKGFVAAMLNAALRAARAPLARPLHVALSYDEEVGCTGVRPMLGHLAARRLRPAYCLIGEPTRLVPATGHKGKTALIATCRGRGGHSALAPRALNALYLATDLVAAIRRLQAEIAERGARDHDHPVPYTTLHVARIEGGGALNIVPHLAQVHFEIRNLGADDPEALIARLRAEAAAIVAATGDADAAIDVAVTGGYPGLDTPATLPAVREVCRLAGAKGTTKVSYGTEAGLFAAALGVPAVVCGPGDMAQGHLPDEFIDRDELVRCDLMLDRLIGTLSA